MNGYPDDGISYRNRFKKKQEQELISNVKKCTGCKTEKGLQGFAFKKATNFYNSRCIACERKRATRTRGLRARKNGIMTREDFNKTRRVLANERLASSKKVCARCKELKSLIEFTRDISNTATADGYRTRCKKCINIYNGNRRIPHVFPDKKCCICLKIFQGKGKCCGNECSKEWTKEWSRGYYYKNRNKFIARNKRWERENIKKIGNKYIKRKLGITNPSQDLIELKREQLKTKRVIRNFLKS